MPGWGLYPNGQEYAGTIPLDGASAWGNGRLTWVPKFPRDGSYEVYVRSFASGVTVTVDERLSDKGNKSRARNNAYCWEHLGQIAVTKGRHHVDVEVGTPQQRNMFDAVLFAIGAFDPATDPLPAAEKNPTVRAPRAYRKDVCLKSAAGSRAVVFGATPPYEEMLNDYVPAQDQLLERVELWGAASQYVNGSFVARALQASGPLTVSLPQLAGPSGAKIGANDIDVRVVHLRSRSLNLWEAAIRGVLLPDLLLRDDRTGVPPKGKQGGFGGGECATTIPAHESRQFWLTIRVPPGSPSGIYQGVLRVTATANPSHNTSLPISLQVSPIDLQPVEGHYSIYYRSQSVDPTQKKAEGNYVPLDRYKAELKDQARHGVNAAMLYGGPATLKYAKEAGLPAAPVIAQWPAADTKGPQHVADAKAMGFPDLYFFGVDEPQGARIDTCRKEAAWRLQNGFHMFTAINSLAAQEALKDVVDRPVYSMSLFSGPDNPAVAYARRKGFVPVSYWMAATPFPLWYRALAGLYNSRCGYQGAAPWCYQDFADNRLYLMENKNYIHAISYPDESGLPIPTLAWEAYRAGVDDVRYLQALDRAIAGADASAKKADTAAAVVAVLAKARAIRKVHFESIDGKIHRYISDLRPHTLDSARRAMADAIVDLKKAQR